MTIIDPSGEPVKGDCIVDIATRTARVEILDGRQFWVRAEGWPGEGKGVQFRIYDAEIEELTSPLTMNEVLGSYWHDQIKWACKGLEGIRKEWQRQT